MFLIFVYFFHKAPLRILFPDYRGIFPKPVRPPFATFAQSRRELNGEMLDVFGEYYRNNKVDHHVWTDQIVINQGTDVTDGRENFTEGDFPNYMTPEQLLAVYSESVLRSPQDHFYLKQTPIMGLGLFARRTIRKGGFCINLS